MVNILWAAPAILWAAEVSAIYITQGIALAILFLADLEVSAFNAFGLFLLWGIQFLWPSTREEILIAYLVWIVAELFQLIRNKKLLYALKAYRKNLT